MTVILAAMILQTSATSKLEEKKNAYKKGKLFLLFLRYESPEFRTPYNKTALKYKGPMVLPGEIYIIPNLQSPTKKPVFLTALSQIPQDFLQSFSQLQKTFWGMDPEHTVSLHPWNLFVTYIRQAYAYFSKPLTLQNDTASLPLNISFRQALGGPSISHPRCLQKTIILLILQALFCCH